MLKDLIAKLTSDDAISKALAQIEAETQRILDEQIYLCSIPSPSNEEEIRAKAYYEMFKALPFDAVWQDDVDNVFGLMKGTGDGPQIMLAAHMDTVFSRDVDITPTVDDDGVIHAPGIGDDTRGMVEVLAIARAMLANNIRPTGNIIFCGDVGEESLGDLRGCRNIFATQNDIDAFISIDGATSNVLHINGVASRKFRITFTGTGGHALQMFGYPNPNMALGRCIAKIADIEVPSDILTIFNVGLVHGGTSINAIPTETTATIDTRSLSEDVLQVLEDRLRAIAEEAKEEENARWNHPVERVECVVDRFARRPGGIQSTQSPLVQTAAAVYEAFGFDIDISEGASTDANIPISLGIPAAAVGRGGSMQFGHTVNELFDPKDGHLGPQRDLVLLLLLGGYESFCQPIIEKRNTAV